MVAIRIQSLLYGPHDSRGFALEDFPELVSENESRLDSKPLIKTSPSAFWMPARYSAPLLRPNEYSGRGITLVKFWLLG